VTFVIHGSQYSRCRQVLNSESLSLSYTFFLYHFGAILYAYMTSIHYVQNQRAFKTLKALNPNKKIPRP
jgi:hypothetical protein